VDRHEAPDEKAAEAVNILEGESRPPGQWHLRRHREAK
jgi:hypothetical protein